MMTAGAADAPFAQNFDVAANDFSQLEHVVAECVVSAAAERLVAVAEQ